MRLHDAVVPGVPASAGLPCPHSLPIHRPVLTLLPTYRPRLTPPPPQGEVFAQSVLDKIAQVVPSAALEVGIVHSIVAKAGTGPAALDFQLLPPASPQTSEAGKPAAAASADAGSGSGSGQEAPGSGAQAQYGQQASSGGSEAGDGMRIHVIREQTDAEDAGITSASAPESLPPLVAAVPAAPGATQLMKVSNSSKAASAEAVESGETAASAGSAVSQLASNAVYVLHRSIVRAPPGSNWVRSFLLERCYTGLWQVTARVWDRWRMPGARLFEVGLILEM